MEPSEASLFESCQRLTSNQEWQNAKPNEGFSYSRAVGWARFPSSFLLTEFGEAEKQRLRRDKITTKIFQLATLSALRTDNGKRDYGRYFILPNSDAYMLSMQVGESSDPTTQAEITKEFDFILDNQLAATNSEDRSQLAYNLEQAYLDGVEPL